MGDSGGKEASQGSEGEEEDDDALPDMSKLVLSPAASASNSNNPGFRPLDLDETRLYKYKDRGKRTRRARTSMRPRSYKVRCDCPGGPHRWQDCYMQLRTKQKQIHESGKGVYPCKQCGWKGHHTKGCWMLLKAQQEKDEEEEKEKKTEKKEEKKEEKKKEDTTPLGEEFVVVDKAEADKADHFHMEEVPRLQELLAWQYLDRGLTEYLRSEDAAVLLHNLGQSLSHAEVDGLVQALATGRRVYYKELCHVKTSVFDGIKDVEMPKDDKAAVKEEAKDETMAEAKEEEAEEEAEAPAKDAPAKKAAAKKKK
mmetsp:Transcript_44098/g.105009  ORF Transcript_44098/g.105009 Transcript_44098/m.105009 type:complete len:311 (-) Transcript_44098:412-1344(-)